MKNALLTTLLRTIASKAIPAIEARAIAWLLENKGDLKDKAGLALDYAMEEYAHYSAKIPMLAASTIDDTIVRQQLKEALDWAWVRIDAQIKQAARDVKQGGVVVTDAYVEPTRRPVEDGVTPTTDADHGPDLYNTPPMKRE